MVIVILICALSASAFAASIIVSRAYDSIYSVEAYASNTGTRASGTISVYRSDTDEYLSNVYRRVLIEYRYYPVVGESLTSGTTSYSTDSRPGCTATVSTSTNTEIYFIRYATFTFSATVPLSSGDRYFNQTTDTLEYIPEEET